MSEPAPERLSAAGLTVFERGWLSSNNVLLTDPADPRAPAVLVDSGHCTHAAQTVALVARALGGRPLGRILNTHLHSDHCGGNARLQRALSNGYKIGQQGDSARGRFVYLWNEGHPGTVIEMAHLTEGRKRIFDAVRAAAVGWDGSDPVRRSWPT